MAAEVNLRDAVFQDWCLTGHGMITQRIKTPNDKIQAIKDHLKNFIEGEP